MDNHKIESQLASHLDLLLPQHQAKEVYLYAVFPGGKLFRANLVWSILEDLNPALYRQSCDDKKSPHALLASSIECHHTYTLLHDDLPSMDNDLTRRGRPCTHLAFTEWKALLTGDGLLIVSFQLLSKIKNINSSRFYELLSLFTWATGPKGLIQGQYLDLSLDRSNAPVSDLDSILNIHQLKTARLIQVAILSSCLMAISKDRKKEKLLWRFSRDLGINFQLLDDLSELSEQPLSAHEQNINPWFLFPEQTLERLVSQLDNFEKMMKELNLPVTKKIVDNYYLKMVSHFENNLKVDFDISSIILKLKGFCN
jgi:geranylgeranyl pyrophosphate synthase